MKGIVITTSKYTKDFLRPLLESIKCVKYPVLIVGNDFDPTNNIKDLLEGKDITVLVNDFNGWEMGGIQRGKEKFDEFVHIMDSTLIKDITMFDKLFEIEGNVALTARHFHYMGKYVSNLLPTMPRMRDKNVAIFHETTWLSKDKDYSEFTPDLPVHTKVMEMIHGQKRMRLENDYMIKWKGTFYI